MELNFKKCVLVLCWDFNAADVLFHIQLIGFDATLFRYGLCGKYLGILIGPGAHDLSFDAPIIKYTRAVQSIRSENAPMIVSTRLYNQEAVSKLSYCIQVLQVPERVYTAERNMLTTLFNMPYHAIVPACAWNLKSFGFPIQVTAIREMALAARYRNTVKTIPSAYTAVQWIEAAWRSEERRLNVDFPGWLREGVCYRCDQALPDLRRTLVPLDGLNCEAPHLQALAYEALWQGAHGDIEFFSFLHKRMSHWFGEDAVEACDHWWDNVRALQRVVPLQVLSSMLRTVANGWTTASRVGGRKRRCRFGCFHGSDTLAHYAVCRHAQALLFDRYGLLEAPGSLLEFMLADQVYPPDSEITARAIHLHIVRGAYHGLKHCTGFPSRQKVVNTLVARLGTLLRKYPALEFPLRRFRGQREPLEHTEMYTDWNSDGSNSDNTD